MARAAAAAARSAARWRARKAAARLVARQVVEEHSGASHEGAFGTDAAEAVLIGYHSCLQLGWMTRDPPIKRYSNGQVVLRR